MSSTVSIETWLNTRKATIRLLRKLAGELDRMQERVNISKIAGTSTGIVAGLGTLGCLLAAPFTGGLSTLGIAGFGAMGVASGTISLGTLIGKHFHEKDLMKEVQTALDNDRIQSEKLNKAMLEETEKLKESELDIPGTGKGAVALFQDGKNLYKGMKQVKAVKAGKDVVSATGSAMKVSKVFTAVTVITVGFDIYDLVQTSINVHKGSINESAAEVRKIAQELEADMKQIQDSYGQS